MHTFSTPHVCFCNMQIRVMNSLLFSLPGKVRLRTQTASVTHVPTLMKSKLSPALLFLPLLIIPLFSLWDIGSKSNAESASPAQLLCSWMLASDCKKKVLEKLYYGNCSGITTTHKSLWPKCLLDKEQGLKHGHKSHLSLASLTNGRL